MALNKPPIWKERSLIELRRLGARLNINYEQVLIAQLKVQAMYWEHILQAQYEDNDPFLALSLALYLLSLGGLPSLTCFFGKLLLFWCGWLASLYFMVSIGLLMSVLSIYYYLKIIMLLMTGQNQEITPHVWNYRGSHIRSNNSIEFSISKMRSRVNAKIGTPFRITNDWVLIMGQCVCVPNNEIVK